MAVALLALAGCATADTETEPTSTKTPNETACLLFENGLIRLLSHASENRHESVDEWHDELAEDVVYLDSIALDAEGDVKERMTTLIDELPDGSSVTEIVLSFTGGYETFHENVQRVNTACTAAGYDWTLV